MRRASIVCTLTWLSGLAFVACGGSNAPSGETESIDAAATDSGSSKRHDASAANDGSTGDDGDDDQSGDDDDEASVGADASTDASAPVDAAPDADATPDADAAAPDAGTDAGAPDSGPPLAGRAVHRLVRPRADQRLRAARRDPPGLREADGHQLPGRRLDPPRPAGRPERRHLRDRRERAERRRLRRPHRRGRPTRSPAGGASARGGTRASRLDYPSDPRGSTRAPASPPTPSRPWSSLVAGQLTNGHAHRRSTATGYASGAHDIHHYGDGDDGAIVLQPDAVAPAVRLTGCSSTSTNRRSDAARRFDVACRGSRVLLARSEHLALLHLPSIRAHRLEEEAAPDPRRGFLQLRRVTPVDPRGPDGGRAATRLPSRLT